MDVWEGEIVNKQSTVVFKWNGKRNLSDCTEEQRKQDREENIAKGTLHCTVFQFDFKLRKSSINSFWKLQPRRRSQLFCYQFFEYWVTVRSLLQTWVYQEDLIFSGKFCKNLWNLVHTNSQMIAQTMEAKVMKNFLFPAKIRLVKSKNGCEYSGQTRAAKHLSPRNLTKHTRPESSPKRFQSLF